MLDTIGVTTVDEFYTDVPESARLAGSIEGLPDHQGELAVERQMAGLAAKNRTAPKGPFLLAAAPTNTTCQPAWT